MMSKLASFPHRGGKQLDELQRHHMLALVFIKNHPGDEIGVIDTEDKFAAAVVMSDLISAGYLTGTLEPGKGGIHLSPRGALAVAEEGTAQ